jgi:hypothetical protein
MQLFFLEQNQIIITFHCTSITLPLQGIMKGENRRTLIKPPICGKSLTNFIMQVLLRFCLPFILAHILFSCFKTFSSFHLTSQYYISMMSQFLYLEQSSVKGDNSEVAR